MLLSCVLLLIHSNSFFSQKCDDKTQALVKLWNENMHQNQVTSWESDLRGNQTLQGRPLPTHQVILHSPCVHIAFGAQESKFSEANLFYHVARTSPTSTNPSMMADSLRRAEGEADSNTVTQSQLFQSCARKYCGEKEGPFDRF